MLQGNQAFQATFSANKGLLTISGCPEGETREFTPFPSTGRWSIEQKTHERATYQSNVLKSLKASAEQRCACGACW